jgi:hypothetical protein
MSHKDVSQPNTQEQWEASMGRRLDELRTDLQQLDRVLLAQRCGGKVADSSLVLDYWNSPVSIHWPDLTAQDLVKGEALSIFNTVLLLYYLHTADGSPMEDRWVSFRELPGGVFYHQAFQRYSGDRMAKIFANDLDSFHRSALAVQGLRLTGLSDSAYAFQPLPRLRMAAILWPGDEEFPTRGSILFDASANHYMVLDGLAVLGSRLVSMLAKAH